MNNIVRTNVPYLIRQHCTYSRFSQNFRRNVAYKSYTVVTNSCKAIIIRTSLPATRGPPLAVLGRRSIFYSLAYARSKLQFVLIPVGYNRIMILMKLIKLNHIFKFKAQGIQHCLYMAHRVQKENYWGRQYRLDH